MTPLLVPVARARLTVLALLGLAMMAGCIATLLLDHRTWLAVLTGLSFLSWLPQLAKLLFDRRPLLVADDSGVRDRNWRHTVPWADVERIGMRRILGLSILSVHARDPVVCSAALSLSALALAPVLTRLGLSPLVSFLSLGRAAPSEVAAVLERELAERTTASHAYRRARSQLR